MSDCSSHAFDAPKLQKLLPCPFCGESVVPDNPMPGYSGGYGFYCKGCGGTFQLGDSEVEAAIAWNTRHERACSLIPGKSVYGERRPKCSECGQSMGDKRWKYCPTCGAKVSEIFGGSDQR